MANRLFQAFIDTAKTIAGYPITVANAVFMRDGSTLDEFSENIPHREDDEDTNIEVPNIDADMLNGHPADYYSKQSDLSALNTSVTQVNNKIGNTDISKWGNSLTGAIKAACDKADANETAIADVNSNLIILEASTQVLMTANRELDDSTEAITIPSGYKPIAMYAYNSNNNDNVSALPLLIRNDGKVLYHAKNHSASDQGVIGIVIRITFKRM